MRKFILFILFLLSCNIYAQTPANKGGQKNLKSPEELEQEYYYNFTEANRLQLLGNIQDAAKLYSYCLKINSNSAASYYQLSRIFLQKQDISSSLYFARMAEKNDPLNSHYSLNIAAMFQYLGMRDSLRSVYERILKRTPNDVELMIALGDAYMQSEFFADAVVLCDSIEKKAGFSILVREMKIEALKSSMKINEALIEVHDLMKRFPDSLNFMIENAVLVGKAKDTIAADSLFKALMVNYPFNALLKLNYLFYLSERKYDTAKNSLFINIIFDRSIKSEIKVKAFYHLLSEKETKSNILTLVSGARLLETIVPKEKSVLALLSDFYLKIDSTNKSIVNLKELIKLNYGNYMLWEQLFFILNKSKQYDSLYANTILIKNTYPDKASLYIYMAIASSQIQKDAEIIDILIKGSELVSDKTALGTIYSFIGESANTLKKYELSDTYYEKALKIDPNDLLVLNNYSYFLSLRDVNLNKAEQMSARTVKIKPDSPSYLDTYGWILYQMGKYNKAKKFIKLALERGGMSSCTILDHYGDIHLKLKKEAMAIVLWKQAFKCDCESEEKINLQEKIHLYEK